ncbi:MAG TPA: hypothetical protein VHE81_21940, partial [Lacipirellulaceae bacterium]|nr:hypothetical protein [Lacipirellulaceae bacterium]
FWVKHFQTVRHCSFDVATGGWIRSNLTLGGQGSPAVRQASAIGENIRGSIPTVLAKFSM